VPASERLLNIKRTRSTKGKHSRKEKQKNHVRKGKKKRSTGPSRVVPHRSTTPARTCLTSLFGWEAVSQADMAALHIIISAGLLVQVALVKEEGNNMRNS
jgi:hypothetical protein